MQRIYGQEKTVERHLKEKMALVKLPKTTTTKLEGTVKPLSFKMTSTNSLSDKVNPEFVKETRVKPKDSPTNFDKQLYDFAAADPTTVAVGEKSNNANAHYNDRKETIRFAVCDLQN